MLRGYGGTNHTTMPHLTLAKATEGAGNITHHAYKLRLRTQMGRCFVLGQKLGHREQILAVAATWEDALSNLLQTQVVEFVQRKKLTIPEDAVFTDIAALYLESPDKLLATYPPTAQPKDELASVPDPAMQALGKALRGDIV